MENEWKIAMKTTLSTDRKIRIPDEIRKADYLSGGDSFELEHLMSGHYLSCELAWPGHFCFA
jgi:hypothetical protein